MTSTVDSHLQTLKQIVFAQFGLKLTDRQLQQFAHYLAALSTSKHNLTSIKDPAEVVIKHFADSLSVAPHLDLEASRTYHLIDVGTGGGFPGVPLAITYPEQLHMTLLDSTTKKINFLRDLTQTLGLKQVAFADMRTEEAGQHPDHRASYDRVVARAVAWMPVLIEYMLPLCKVGGLCIAMKGASAIREVEEARCALKRMGGKVLSIEEVSLDQVEETHYLVKVAKVRPTPRSYPRRVGLPKKEPILCR